MHDSKIPNWSKIIYKRIDKIMTDCLMCKNWNLTTGVIFSKLCNNHFHIFRSRDTTRFRQKNAENHRKICGNFLVGILLPCFSEFPRFSAVSSLRNHWSWFDTTHKNQFSRECTFNLEVDLFEMIEIYPFVDFMILD
jgi:hypothetical protein